MRPKHVNMLIQVENRERPLSERLKVDLDDTRYLKQAMATCRRRGEYVAYRGQRARSSVDRGSREPPCPGAITDFASAGTNSETQCPNSKAKICSYSSSRSAKKGAGGGGKPKM
uniref:Uncharacterized protein n=1 Tax=Opuntia streptacantha TaxID=393608 RepID=A0A7C8ZAL2_OPUST